jgi:hypothetical protein
LYQGDLTIQEGLLIESTTTTGYYSAQIEALWSSVYLYTVRISIQSDGYESTSNYTHTFTPRFDSVASVAGAIAVYGPYGIVFLAAVGSVVVARRYNKKKKLEQYREALELRKRIDDADNLIGIMLVHKASGIPIYARSYTQHIDTGMISGFITAITHFRTEFSLTGDAEIGKVLPMSDIIHVVPTRNMLVAVITLGNPSSEQNSKISEYGKALALTYDDFADEVPTQELDRDTAAIIDTFFEEYLDANLGMLYRKKSATPFPKKLGIVEKAIDTLDSEEGFKLRSILTAMADLGATETDAYLLLQETLDEGLLSQVDSLELDL